MSLDWHYDIAARHRDLQLAVPVHKHTCLEKDRVTQFARWMSLVHAVALDGIAAGEQVGRGGWAAFLYLTFQTVGVVSN